MRTRIVPPSGMASTALRIRLVSASRISDSLATMAGISGSSVSKSIWKPSAWAWSTHFGLVSEMASRTTSFSDTPGASSVWSDSP